MKQYEAMFLFDPTFGSSFENCESEIRRLMERAQGEIILCRKWDERRLAYRIQGRKRGVYVLVYFKAPPDKIAPLERDGKLSEHILRVLVLRAEGMSREAMERAFTAWQEEPLDGAVGDRPPVKPTGAIQPDPGKPDKERAVPDPLETETADTDTQESPAATTE